MSSVNVTRMMRRPTGGNSYTKLKLVKLKIYYVHIVCDNLVITVNTNNSRNNRQKLSDPCALGTTVQRVQGSEAPHRH
jgi:hypothetical protein